MSGQLEFGEEDHAAALRQAWELCLHLLAMKVSKVSLETYIRPVQPLDYKDNIVTLGVSNAFYRERIEKNHANAIRSALEFHLDTTGLQVRFVVMSKEQQAVLDQASGSRKTRTTSRADSPAQTSLPLDSDPLPEPRRPENPVSQTPPAFLQGSLNLTEPLPVSEQKTEDRRQKTEDEKRNVAPSVRTPEPERRTSGSSPKSKIQNPKSDELPVPTLPLNEKYQLGNYLVGRSNRFAHANAVAVATRPGHAYNPLFLYGGPGLGKTHLMQGIANAIRAHSPNLRLAYVTGEYFATTYITAIREHATENFRRQHRLIDVWLVDDIQFIASKEHTKEEFFHTFNTLYQGGKQIVIASDRSPRDLNTLDERLRSRFQSGLIADITPPELETRLAFLHNLREREKAPVPDNILEFIANAIQSNMRTLEGAITKLMAYSSIMNAPINDDLAHDVLGEYFIEKRPRRMRLSLESIADVVAAEFGVEARTLKGTGRNKDIALARQIAIYLCRELLPQVGTREVGIMFGGRDHATVVRACQRVEDTMGVDPNLNKLIEAIIKKLSE